MSIGFARYPANPASASQAVPSSSEIELSRTTGITAVLASRRVARRAGHSPSMALDTYGHVFDELDGDKQRPAEEAIRKARAKVIREAGAPSVHPREKAVASSKNKTPRFAESL